MEYEIVTLKKRIAVGLSARTNDTDPDMSEVIGGLWARFFGEGVYASISDKVNEKALGIYTDYAGNEKNDYTVLTACEVHNLPENSPYTVCTIPAGRYARFIVKGDMRQAVAQAWQEIWSMQLPRNFQCDFEEYQNDDCEHAEIHLYIGLI